MTPDQPAATDRPNPGNSVSTASSGARPRATALSLAEVAHRAYTTQACEADQALEVEYGKVPEGLRGALYRIGPGRFDRGGLRYAHQFDGDGMVARFGFSNAGVHYRNRFVRTREFLDEEQADQILYRAFGTNRPGGIVHNMLRVHFKNAANTGVILYDDKVLALWEGGLPHALDPDTLETRGREDFDGALSAQATWVTRYLGGELPFSAHPKVDPVTGELFNFGTLMGPSPQLLLYHGNARGHVDKPRTVPLERLHFIHDFALTARHRVFFLSPVAFDIGRALLGRSPPVDTIHSVERAGSVLLLTRHGDEPTYCQMSSPCFPFHVANGYEDEDGTIRVDCTRWKAFPVFPDLRLPAGEQLFDGPPPYLTRFTIDPHRGRVTEEQLCDMGFEFPCIHPGRVGQPHRFVWGAGLAPTFDHPGASGVIKVDTLTHQSTVFECAPDLAGEPLFIPRPDAVREEDGWIAVLVYVSACHRTDLVVLDASSLELVFRARLPHHLPPGFHGTWVPEAA